MIYFSYLVLAVVTILAVVLFLLYRHNRNLHRNCVNLCHRLANELSKRQKPELVVERVFNIIVDHTQASMAILVFSDTDKEKQVLRVDGIDEKIIKAGDYLQAGQQGYGFGSLAIDNTATLYDSRKFREAVYTNTGIQLTAKQNMMVIPITSHQQTHGLLQLVSGVDKPFSKQSIKDLSGMGIYLDAAIQNANKIETISRQRDAAKSLYSIGLTISHFLRLEEILHYTVKETHHLMKADFSWYMELYDEKGESGIVRNISGDLNEHIDSGSIFPLGGRIVALLNMPSGDHKKKYILIKNLSAHEGEGPIGYASSKDSPFCEASMFDVLEMLQVKSGIILPVASEQHIHGLLCSFSHQTNFFDKFDVDLQQRIANQVLIAINSADHHAKAGRLALVEERQRMSDELHDNMAQVINGLSLELHSFIKLVEQEKEKKILLERLKSLRPSLDQAKAIIRENIFELRVPEGIGVWENLDSFAKSFQKWHNFKIHTDLPSADLRLDITQQHELIRIVQEALWNIHKHSGTREAWLHAMLKKEPLNKQLMQIIIEDRGCGFSSQQIEAGQGITTMQKRIERLQGQLNITPNTPQGTLIILEIPYVGK